MVAGPEPSSEAAGARERGRRIGVWALIVLASVSIVLALVIGYVQRAVVNSDQFANRATVALRDEAVRGLIAERVTDEVVLRQRSDLVAARPLIQTIVSSALGGRAFGRAFRDGVRDVHRAVFERDENTVSLALGDVGTIVAAGLEVVRPSLARQVRLTGRINLVSRDIGSVSAEAVRAARTVRILAWLFLVLAAASTAGAIGLARDRRAAVVRLGVGVAIGAVVLVVALRLGRSAFVDAFVGDEARDAADAVWGAFMGDLRTAAWILGGIGAVVAAAAASLLRPVELDRPLRRAWDVIRTDPARPALRVVRGVAFVAAGLLCLLDRGLVLQVVFAAVGLYLMFSGVSAVLWVIQEHEPGQREVEAAAGVPRASRWRTGVAALVAAGLVAVAVGGFVATGGATTPPPAPGDCDGSSALCDRTLQDVALPATHNAMSAPLPGWFASQQDRPIAQQLRDGIRGLLIDTHYADRLSNGRLRTEIGDTEELRRKAAADGVSPEAVDAALRIRKRIGFSGEGTRGIYLCHTFCELGGTPLQSVLRDLHDYLVANPGAVVVVINQDYITPEDFVAAVDEAGLGRLAYRGPTETGRWWTLREMIDRDQRVVFLAENRAGAAPWYHLAYKAITKETPFSFSRPQQLTDPAAVPASCRPNRGPEDAPLFLVNHWITTDPLPLPSNAAKVNAYEPLLRRLKECRRIRHHVPNLVAVDFYRRGDLLRAVDTLNGVADDEKRP